MAHCLRVLLVEDSKVLTERLTEAIRQIPQVELIGTADTEATAVASAQRDSIDVIILDLHLKQGTGFGVMRALATAHLKPRIIVLTNYDLPEYKNAAIALGASHFLDKARDYGRLPEVLHEICEAHLAKQKRISRNTESPRGAAEAPRAHPRITRARPPAFSAAE